MSAPSARPPATPLSSGAILLVSPEPEDSAILRDILSSSAGGIESVPGWNQATSLLQNGAFGVVITERDLPDGSWLDVLSVIQALSQTPLLIVVSRLADDRLWAEVLNRCGFDVLLKPFVRDEVIRVVGHALRKWSEMAPKRPAVRAESGSYKSTRRVLRAGSA